MKAHNCQSKKYIYHGNHMILCCTTSYLVKSHDIFDTSQNLQAENQPPEQNKLTSQEWSRQKSFKTYICRNTLILICQTTWHPNMAATYHRLKRLFYSRFDGVTTLIAASMDSWQTVVSSNILNWFQHKSHKVVVFWWSHHMIHKMDIVGQS